MFNVKNQIIKPILLHTVYLKKKTSTTKGKWADSALNGQCDGFKMKMTAGLVT